MGTTMDADREKPQIIERFEQGVKLADAGEYEAATAFHLETLQERPRSKFYEGAILGSLGAVAFRAGKYDDAIKYYYQSIKIYPGFASTYTFLHQALTKRGRSLERIYVFLLVLKNLSALYSEQMRLQTLREQE